MIQFECRCHHVFQVADEQAGDAVQCPQCGLLNDVPVLSQLKDLDEHGNYKVGEDTTLKEPDRLAELNRAFAPTRLDEQGNEIDLRTTLEELEIAGTDDGTFEFADEVRPAAPKYDPITGELIRPIEVQEDHRPQQPPIPMASPALEYARQRQHSDSRVSAAGALALLFGPENLIVIFFVFLIAVFGNLLFAGPIALLAHFANVVDETGPEERDELPRPFRHLSWSDDLWGPFVQFFFALMYSYCPLLAIGPLGLPFWQSEVLVVIFGIFGSLVFPGVLLTTTTSGTVLNLRPDRVMMTIRRSGPLYIWATLVWIAALPLYIRGIVLAFVRSAMLLVQGKMGTSMEWLLAYSALLGGIILMHYFCWLLGLIYRQHQPDFPWVLQRHTPIHSGEGNPMLDARARAEARRRAEREAYRQMRG